MTATCSPKIWKRLCAIYAARENAKSRERDLVTQRKALEKELDALGAGSTSKHLKTSREFVVCIRAIDYERDRSKELADMLGATISSGMQGKFEFDEDEFDAPHAVTEEDLFKSKEDDGEDPKQGKLPVGGPSATEPPKRLRLAPAPAQPEGVDEHLAASVNELDMRDNLKGLLVKAGIEHINQVTQILDGEDGRGKLRDVANLNENQAAAVAVAVTKYRKAHRSAMREADGTNG